MESILPCNPTGTTSPNCSKNQVQQGSRNNRYGAEALNNGRLSRPSESRPVHYYTGMIRTNNHPSTNSNELFSNATIMRPYPFPMVRHSTQWYQSTHPVPWQTLGNYTASHSTRPVSHVRRPDFVTSVDSHSRIDRSIQANPFNLKISNSAQVNPIAFKRNTNPDSSIRSNVIIPKTIVIPKGLSSTGTDTSVKVLPGKRSSSDFPSRSKSTGKKVKGDLHGHGCDKLDLLCSATLELGPLQENPTGCSCPKSRCIALYCDCFKAGRRCDPMKCTCLNCKNTVEESGPNGARSLAIQGILARNPRAFKNAGNPVAANKTSRGDQGCNCFRSRCLKLYCTCFQQGKICDPSICTCVGCLNIEDDISGMRKFAIEITLEKRPDAFKKKSKTRILGAGCACKNNQCVRKYCECFRTALKCTKKCSCKGCKNGKNSELGDKK